MRGLEVGATTRLTAFQDGEYWDAGNLALFPSQTALR